MLNRGGFIAAAASTAALPLLPAYAADKQVLRVGMTAADLPSTHGIRTTGSRATASSAIRRTTRW